ncbi:MAG: ureidoglycolate lyase [Salinisphaera sp.]|jgi:ureidoglycolate lyase|nr:ureidoglycolate lyase [Salinisphaera sp.]
MSAQNHDKPTAITLTAVPLTAEQFAPYGDVIESTGPSNPINQGKGWRYPELAGVDVTTNQGYATISRVACVPEAIPVPLRVLERHPLGSQAFIPVDGQRYLVVVAPAGEPPGLDALQAFVADSHQGINYHRGVWHHPMIALDAACEFVEVHRAGPGDNCDEIELGARITVGLTENASENRP